MFLSSKSAEHAEQKVGTAILAVPADQESLSRQPLPPNQTTMTSSLELMNDKRPSVNSSFRQSVTPAVFQEKTVRMERKELAGIIRNGRASSG
jgi:hypothetical protein